MPLLTEFQLCKLTPTLTLFSFDAPEALHYAVDNKDEQASVLSTLIIPYYTTITVGITM
jgi:hypothetical protein